MKTPDETKRRFAEAIEESFFLAGCVDHDLIEARGKAHASMADALAYIRQLEADNAQQARCIENMTDKLNAANDEVAMLQAQAPKWISVEDEYPDSKLAVLVLSQDYYPCNVGEKYAPSVHVGYTRGEDEGWFDFHSRDHLNVTHWMHADFLYDLIPKPLPEPPKEDTHEQ